MSRGGHRLTLIGDANFRSFRNVWLLEELGLRYTHVPALPQSKRARATNALGKIPTLIDAGGGTGQPFAMSESAAINTYLGDVFRGGCGEGEGAALVPVAGTTQRGRYDQLVHCLMAEVDAQGLWIHRKHEALAQHFGAIPPAVAHAKQHHARVLKALTSEHLLTQDYLLGHTFSAADILFVHCLDWAASIGWASWQADDCKHAGLLALPAYLARCKQRPAFKRAQAIKQRSAAKL